MDGKRLDSSDGTVYCGGECVFKVWDCSNLEPYSVQYTEILGIFTQGKVILNQLFAYQRTACQKTQLKF